MSFVYLQEQVGLFVVLAVLPMDDTLDDGSLLGREVRQIGRARPHARHERGRPAPLDLGHHRRVMSANS